MAAIAGAIGFVGPAIDRAVRDMVSALRHRGGERVGVLSIGANHLSKGAILGATYPCVADASERSEQPTVDSRTASALVYDGSIYNLRALREQLRTQGQTLHSSSDTQVLLSAYSVFGQEFVRRLEGMFALAVWDPERREVLLARDRLGFKPLYWGEHRSSSGAKTILFASEVKALLGTGLFPRRIDPVALQAYAWNGFVVSPRSLVQGIQCLQPGKQIRFSVDTCGLVEQRYWLLGDHESSRGGASEIGDALRQAVERQLRCDAPVGFFLSGGMDSSAVVALACQVAAGPVRTFNVAFDDVELDESPYARAVAQALGTDHTEIRIQQHDFQDGLDAWLRSVDQPTFDGLNTFLVSRAVRDAGIGVALGGTGADDLFGGNRTFREIPLIAKWARNLSGIPTPLLRSVAGLVTRLKTGKGTVPHQARWGKLADVLTTRGNLLDLYQLTYALFTPDFIGRLLTQAGSLQLRVGIPRSYADEIEVAVLRNSEMYGISIMEMMIFLGERLLRDLDCASQSVGLEVRVPFLDDRVIEAWRATSEKTSYEPLGKKQVLLDTALSRLNPSLFDRPKAGFVLPIDRWCREGLGDTVEKTFANAEHCRAVGIDPLTVQRLWTAFKRADSGLYWSRIWSIFIYLRVCEREGLELEAQP